MLKSVLKISVLGLLTVALAGGASPLMAQTNEKAAPVKKAAHEKKQTGQKKERGIPFRGTLKAIDKVAKTITVGERTFQITSETRIFKNGKPAILDDGTVDEPITGAYRKGEEGKLTTLSVYYGGKGEAKGSKKEEGTEKKEGKEKKEKKETKTGQKI